MAKARKRRVRGDAATEKKRSSLSLWLVGGGFLILVLIVAAISISNSNSAANPSVSMTAFDENMPAEWINERVVGNPEATVTVEAWEDFLCPACGSWNQRIKPMLIQEYIQDGDSETAGTVKLSFRHFPLQIHAPGARIGAAASECANDQGAFWPYHDRLFAVQTQGQPAFRAESLIRYAEELGLDGNEFQQCMVSQKYISDVDASASEAFAQELGSTPSILINGKLMEDPFNYDSLKAEIDGILAAN